MKLKIRKLHSNAEIPKKAHADDVGFDLVAVECVVVNEKDHGYIEYRFGISVQPSPGFYCEIVPRSSISKTGLWLANSLGVIDPKIINNYN